MSQLEITLQTGHDDLRNGSWANLNIKLKNQELKQFPEFTGRGGLNNDSTVTKKIELPELRDPNQVEFFQLEHISQEGFLQTRDNWNLNRVQVILRLGRFPVLIAEHAFHRFTGSSSLLTFYPPAA